MECMNNIFFETMADSNVKGTVLSYKKVSKCMVLHVHGANKKYDCFSEESDN